MHLSDDEEDTYDCENTPWYPIRSTWPPCLAMLIAWYCIRGLRPMSPRTKIWTDAFGLEAGPLPVGED